MPPKEVLKLGAITVLLTGAVIYIGSSWRQPQAPIVFKNEKLDPDSDSKTVKATQIQIQVAGAVRRPGVYKLPVGSRVHDAIRTAGGAKTNAYLDEWNLAARLEDGVQVFINSKAPSASRSNREPARKLAARKAPTIAPLHVEVPESLRGSLSLGTRMSNVKVEPSGSAKGNPPKSALTEGLISLNTASLSDLDLLPGVGPATAQKIIDYRKEHGGFTSIDELLAVPRIGPKRLAAMRKYVRL